MNLKAIIFDLDGVITDTAHLHFKAWSKIAEKFGYTLSETENERIKGLSRRKSLEVILEMIGIELPEKEILDLLVEKNGYYQEYLQELSKEDTLPGFDHFYDECKQRGIKLGVGSASKNAKIILDKLGKIDHFDAIVDGTMVKKSKPDPEVFLLGAKAMSVSPNETVVFEDAIAGVHAGNRGGFFTVGIGNQETLSHADLVISSHEGFTLYDLQSEIAKRVSQTN